MRRLSFLVCSYFLLSVSLALGNDERVFCDFEGDNYGDWKVEGEAFGTAPTKGTLPNQLEVSCFRGERLANSFNGGDVATGKLISPSFTIESNYISFLIGGSGLPGNRVDLISEGSVLRSACGPNFFDGAFDDLYWTAWDVSDLKGREAHIEIIDEETRDWGHLLVDHIVFGDVRHNAEPIERTMTLNKRYLHIPIDPKAPTMWFDVEVDGEKVREYHIELAEDADSAMFYGTIDLAEYVGREIKLVAERYLEENTGIDAIKDSDELSDEDKVYKEKYRPQFHFSPRRGWLNDPNGLVYYKGEYHFFHQHNPYGLYPHNLSWGHAVSTDLFHWKELSDALVPDKLGGVYSGSGVVDLNNTTGFQTGEDAPLVAISSRFGPAMRYGGNMTQCVAYSNDLGRSWRSYEGNPVLPHIVAENRDPKVFWYEPTKRWVMALFMDKEDYALFESPNLKEWTKLCDIPNLGCSECPDMFELPVDGDEKNKKWIFWGGNGKYVVGTFDGKTFVKEYGPLDMKWGGNDYAAQTFNNAPGRCVQMSWMGSGPFPGMPFNQQASLPRELTLRSTDDGPRLCANPVKELETLRGEGKRVENIPLENATVVSVVDSELLDVETILEPGDAEWIELTAHGQKLTLLPKEGVFVVDGFRVPLRVIDGKIELRLVFDRASVEIFANGGFSHYAKRFDPIDGQTFGQFEWTTVGQGAKILSLQTWALKGVWDVQ